MSEDRVIKIAGKDVTLKQEFLTFDEHTINNFLQKSAGNHASYSAQHADAQFIHSTYEDRAEAVYAEKFKLYREESSSDKMADMKTKCDKEVQEAQEMVRLSKHNANLLYGFTRSLDRAHESCKEFCYNLRKEMDKIFGSTIKSKIEDMI